MITLEQAASICYPERLSEYQVERLQAITESLGKIDVFTQAKQNATFWKEMVCRLLVPTPISHDEIIRIMERVTERTP